MTDWDALLGRRVALRHRIGVREGRPLLSDAVGELADGGVVDGEPALVVATRRGDVVVARAAVVAVRAVPPAVPRRASWTAVARLEGLCADAVAAAVDRPLGGWRLRAGGGAPVPGALAADDPEMPMTDALAQVRAFAEEHGGMARVRTPIGSPWSRAVLAAGWAPDPGQPPQVLLVAELAALAARAAAVPVAFVAAPDAAWRAVAASGPGGFGPPDPGPHPATPAGGHGAPAAPAVGYGTAPAPDPAAGPAAGAVRVAVVEDHLHVSRLTVLTPERRRGVGTALLAAAAGWGLDRGARWAVLAVPATDADALAFAAALGATEHHRSHHLVAGGS